MFELTIPCKILVWYIITSHCPTVVGSLALSITCHIEKKILHFVNKEKYENIITVV